MLKTLISDDMLIIRLIILHVPTGHRAGEDCTCPPFGNELFPHA